MKAWPYLFAAAAVFAGHGPAQPAQCDPQAGISEQIECATTLLAREDAELNRTWKRVMVEHPSGGVRTVHREEIRAAQRLWIKFRDADCEAQSKVGIPRYWELNRVNCLITMTRRRTNTLTGLYLF